MLLKKLSKQRKLNCMFSVLYMFRLTFRNISNKYDTSPNKIGLVRSNQFYFSKELRAVEVRVGQGYRLPTDEMRPLGFVGAFIEIGA